DLGLPGHVHGPEPGALHGLVPRPGPRAVRVGPSGDPRGQGPGRGPQAPTVRRGHGPVPGRGRASPARGPARRRRVRTAPHSPGSLRSSRAGLTVATGLIAGRV